ncbi:MAG TPA: bifunctional UDP-N-acetylglucosamine diphosphorylase/glucosamine-1-phosphate N-acetyltransferase GlmU [Pseudobdellovibrionaceae bacterium]|nr:bifunctional UDP-N-acetylglucosamine diphosphorylase/glucosamine-1-phosphate N-acetyltransferase GlmU [Pseudobdellovibrionaceae bacterium]
MSKHEKSKSSPLSASASSSSSDRGGGKSEAQDPSRAASGKSQSAFTPLTAIVLAAGKGTRMKSPLPKVLHPVAGLPMIMRVMTAARDAGCRELRIVVGHGEALVRKVVEPLGGLCFQQKEQRGTADAVRAADIESIEGLVLVLCGDAPLVTADDLKALVQEFKDRRLDVAVITSRLKRPASLGRIIRQPLGSVDGPLRAIVEASDASAETLRVREVNSGAYILKAEALRELLPRIDNKNSKGEFYFTDIITLAIEAGHKVDALRTRPAVAFGVNSQAELAAASRVVFNRNRQRLMAEGVVMLDPSTVYAEDEVQIGSGSVVYPNVMLRGRTRIGAYCVLEPGTHILSSTLGDGVHVKSGCYIDHAQLENRVSIGPYAHLRPDTILREESHVGNFVEMKKTDFGARSKAGHLTYLGDATVGQDVNIGCGTITCNYAPDRKKYRTIIGDGSFVGSDVQFVAPINIGKDATIASGSTITEDVPERALAIARGRQVNKPEWSPKRDVTTSAGGEPSVTSTTAQSSSTDKKR